MAKDGASANKYQLGCLTHGPVKNRPPYPDALYETIHTFCKKTWTGKERAVAIGCGNGLGTIPFKKYYSEVVGIDDSRSEIFNAPMNIPGLSFHLAAVEDLSFVRTSSVDLITVHNALHWLNKDKLYAGVDRVLKPGGTFAAYAPGLLLSDDYPDLSDYIYHIFWAILKDYWADGMRALIDDRYDTTKLPYEESVIRSDDLSLQITWTIHQLIEFIESWSAMKKFHDVNPDTDIRKNIREELCEIGEVDEETIDKTKFKFTEEIYTVMCHKPESPR